MIHDTTGPPNSVRGPVDHMAPARPWPAHRPAACPCAPLSAVLFPCFLAFFYLCRFCYFYSHPATGPCLARPDPLLSSPPKHLDRPIMYPTVARAAQVSNPYRPSLFCRNPRPFPSHPVLV
ncbi:hypothetical protein K461DRAFT_155397 [Myriangium duriaei CBS 260.36]|uniref:Uncharacterized protein n=1 Tax=Myriangium duriaei CBS 260.36 TaxID=1168546 RepID=A0A9P4MG22_9PEZI|nr:hypothetical protein K461DRAFT_155397 [Myriangium duriaei CBS 260.36]